VPVHAQLFADVLDPLGVGYLPGEQIGGIAADPVEQDENKQHHAEQGRHELPGAADDVSEHRQLT
jgi:hypothetical protein